MTKLTLTSYGPLPTTKSQAQSCTCPPNPPITHPLPQTTSPKVGTTEAVFFYFPSSLTPRDRNAMMDCFNPMQSLLERSESLKVYGGWNLETEVPNPRIQASLGEKSRVLANAIRWVNVEAFQKSQSSEDFQQTIHHLLEMKDISCNELYHVKLYVLWADYWESAGFCVGLDAVYTISA